MMGRKKLNEIRKELQQALSTIGRRDPIRWLEERMRAAAEREPPERSEVLRSLKRILETAKRGTQRRQQVGAKK